MLWTSVSNAEAKLADNRRLDLLPIVVLAGLVSIGLACWWLVPAFLHVMKHQSCIASGRMDC